MVQLSNCCPKIPTTKIVSSCCDWLGYQAQIHGGFRQIPCFNNTFFPSHQLNTLTHASIRRVPVSCKPHLLSQWSPRQDPPSTPIPSGCLMFRCVDLSGFMAIHELTWVPPLGQSERSMVVYQRSPWLCPASSLWDPECGKHRNWYLCKGPNWQCVSYPPCGLSPHTIHSQFALTPLSHLDQLVIETGCEAMNLVCHAITYCACLQCTQPNAQKRVAHGTSIL